MENMHDDVKDILERLKEQAENTNADSDINTQTTDTDTHNADDIKDLLKKQFAAEEEDLPQNIEDYSFDTEDFVRTGEIQVPVEEKSEEVIEETIEEPLTITEETEEIIEENTYEETAVNENPVIDDVLDEILDESESIVNTTVEEIAESVSDDATLAFEAPSVEENENYTIVFSASTQDSATTDINAEEKVDDTNEFDEIKEYVSSNSEPEYGDILEGQQGTVFNQFVEDFSSDLDDVVFEAEITESRAPDKQYTIFEDWEKLMKDKQYETAEEGIIPPTKEELEYSAEIKARERANTDYFTPVAAQGDMDEVDIALMVALGGEEELNQTVGFEKIRQAVNNVEEEKYDFDGKRIFGFCGDEYSTIGQNGKIKRKYKRDKIGLIIKTVVAAIVTLALLSYEVAGWMGKDIGGIFSITMNPELHVLAALLLLLTVLTVSASKIKGLFKNMLETSSIAYIGAMIVSILSILHDVLILTIGYADPGATVHSLAAILLLLSLIYDTFDVFSQSGTFDIISKSDKKLILEPYGKLRMSEEDTSGDVIDKDSYCISKISSVGKFFERISRPTQNITGKLIALVLCFSVSLVVMLVLLLMGEQIGTIVLSLIVTLSFTLICASIFESEFAFFTVYLSLKKHKTGIVGKSSVEEYGKCNIVYFDDFNVFNKKSVRTKGLKLYDNNEIYKILYHTQAVFSKVGGPLKAVFEFATSEMVHSKNVDIREISKEGICALVDNRTAVLIGTGSFMKSRGIHPSYTSADLKLEESGEDSIMFIALNGTLGAKLYVTYQFSSEFERLAKKLSAHGVGIGIRSSDPNINNKWARHYGESKNCSISVVRPTLKDNRAHDKAIDGGVVSAKNVRALTEALMMCVRLYSFENIIGKLRISAILLIGVLTFALVLVSGVNTVSMLLLMLACALSASVMILLSYFYIKR